MFEDALPSAGEVRALAAQLLSWADRLAAKRDYSRDLSDEERQELVVGLADAALRVRRVRTRIFAGIPLAEPAWDVLLDMFIKDANGYRVSLDTLAVDSDHTPETVSMCVDLLSSAALIERVVDRFDTRILWLSLTEDGKSRMTQLLLASANFLGLRPDDELVSTVGAG